MIKICPRCKSTWAGGLWCEDCGGSLIDPFSDEAAAFPEDVWRYIRLQYGARRGMLVRVIGILLGPIVFGVLLRRAMSLPSPWSWVGAAGAAVAGVGTWALLHFVAGKAVRVWVLCRGRLPKAKLARAMWKRARPGRVTPL